LLKPEVPEAVEREGVRASGEAIAHNLYATTVLANVIRDCPERKQ
jgi:hypothetical protein